MIKLYIRGTVCISSKFQEQHPMPAQWANAEKRLNFFPTENGSNWQHRRVCGWFKLPLLQAFA